MLHPTTINLKDNLFISTDRRFPEGSTKMLTTSLEFLSENECIWYVPEIDKRFKDYLRKDASFSTAKSSITSAVMAISPKGSSVKKVMFNIYSVK